MARGSRRQWFRERSQAIPVATRFAIGVGSHFHRVRVRPRLRALATYSVGSGQYCDTRSG